MNHQQVRKFLAALGSDPGEVPQGDKWVTAHCPLAPWTHDSGTDSNPSFAISCNPGGESRFHCFACESGDLYTLVQRLKNFGAQKPKYDLKTALEVWAEEEEDKTLPTIKDFEQPPPEQEVVIPWSEDWLSTFFRAVDVPVALEYLHGRSVSTGTADALDIRWDGSKECVSFPVRDWEGRLCGLRGRRIAGGYYDYGGPYNHRNKLVWYGEDGVDSSRTVLMVESVFDYASVWRVYRNVVAPLTVGISKSKAARMGSALEIITLFDNGKGGDKARNIISKYLGGGGRIIKHLTPPKHRGDPGEMTVEELHKLLNPFLKLMVDITD